LSIDYLTIISGVALFRETERNRTKPDETERNPTKPDETERLLSSNVLQKCILRWSFTLAIFETIAETTQEILEN